MSLGTWNLGGMVDNRAHAAQDRRNIPGRFSQPQNEIRVWSSVPFRVVGWISTVNRGQARCDREAAK
jgi:hypothetical protein